MKITRREMTTNPTGTETVLLAEDEQMVRRVARRVLEKHGYKVIETDSGGPGLELQEKRRITL